MAIDKNNGLPLCEGEFISVTRIDGEATVHVLSSIQEYPDAPAGSSGLRFVYPIGMEVPINLLVRRITNDCGIYQFMSEFKQNVEEKPIEQEEFDGLIAAVRGVVGLRRLLNDELGSGLWFVRAAKSCFSYQDAITLEEEWKKHRLKADIQHPTASVAYDWIDSFWVKEHPEMDVPWLRDEAFTEISCIEEQCEPPVESGQQNPLVGRKLRIDEMSGEPQYAGRIGTVTMVDDAGQLHGTWGGCALVPGEDRYTFLDDGLHGALRAPSAPGDDPSRAPYETYRETEVFGVAANLSLAQMLDIHRRSNHTDLVMTEWLSAIDDAELWELDGLAKEPERLFELIMSLETMYQTYGRGGHAGLHDRCDFAYAVSEAILDDDGLLFEDLYNDPTPVYDILDQMD